MKHTMIASALTLALATPALAEDITVGFAIAKSGWMEAYDTPAATAALPPVSAIRRMAPVAILSLCSSIRAGRSLPVTPLRTWAKNGTPLTSRTSAAACPPPDMASSRRNCATSFDNSRNFD